MSMILTVRTLVLGGDRVGLTGWVVGVIRVTDTPHVQDDTVGDAFVVGAADVYCIVEPRIRTVDGCLKYGLCVKVTSLSVGRDEAAVAYMDSHAIIGADIVERLEIGTTGVGMMQLKVCSPFQYLASEPRAAERAPVDRYG